MLKYKFKLPTSGDTQIKIPISMENQMVDQSEIIERKFVDTEVEKSINPIFDYEKAKFPPYRVGNVPSKRLNYNVNMLDSGSHQIPTYYNDIGFDDNDLESRTNAFRNTFLRLNFYDTDRLSDQRLLFFITLFSNVYDDDLEGDGTVANADSKQLQFKIISEKELGIYPKEGFNIFYFSDEVTAAGPDKEVFMRAELNNAKTGAITTLMTTSNLVGIDNLVNQLHTKYILRKDSVRGYHYILDSAQSNVSYNGNRIDINLYEVNVL